MDKQNPEVAHPTHGGCYVRMPDGTLVLEDGVDEHPLRPAQAEQDAPEAKEAQAPAAKPLALVVQAHGNDLENDGSPA